MFSRHSVNNNEYPRVLIYINIWLIQLQFSLRKDIMNHKDINLILFFNNSIICFISNIYSDKQQFALKYLKIIEANLNNVLIVIENFNIRDNDWDPSYSHHSIYSDILMEIVNSFNLSLSTPIIQVSTQYADNSNNSNSVIDLMFLQANSSEFNNHSILPDLWSSLDYASLTVNIIINKMFI